MPHGNTKGVRAWHVRERTAVGVTPRAVAVFSSDIWQAKKIGANLLELPFVGVTVKRAYEFDQYVDLGRVPLVAYLRAGWQFDCQVCGKPVLLGPESIEWGEFYFDSRECQQQFALQFDEHGYKRKQT